jgi:L-amino acid N-acyltransferase YncA
MTHTTDIKSQLPKEFVLQGRHVTLHPLAEDHRDAVLAFAQALPPNDLLFLRRDITQPACTDAWIQETEAGSVITIVACEGSRIVGYVTFDRGGVQWSRHVAEIQVVVAESIRGLGVGRLLLELAFELALAAGVQKVVARMTPNQTQAIRLFQTLGFEHEATLHDHAIGVHGCLHDIWLFSYHVKQHQDNVCDGCGTVILAGLPLEGKTYCPLCFQTECQELGGGD